MKSIIRNYLAKLMAGRADDGIMITLKDPQRVTLAENILMDTLMRYGIDPTAITSEQQLKNILQQIKNSQAAAIRNTGIRNTDSAKVFNIEGQKLDPNKPIVGGTQTGKELSSELAERLRGTEVERIKQKIADKKIDGDLPPPGSRGGKDDIAAPVQSSEESLRDMIMAQNKANIDRIRGRKKMLDEAIDDASPGFSGDRKVDAELVAENLAERMGLVYDDMPTKERLDLYDQAYQGLTKKIDIPEDFATGGRVGFFKGAVASGEDISPGTDTRGNVRDDNPFTGGGGGGDNNNQPPPKKIKLPEPVKEGINTYNNLNYLKNIYKLNPKGIMLDIGKQFLMNKFFSKADTGQDPNMMLAFEPGSIKDKQLKQMYNIFQETGMENPMMKDLMKEDIEQGGPLSLPEEAYQTAADGGIMRLGFKDGMNRRTFLKLLGGLASIPIVGKFIKPLKTVKGVKKVPIIKTGDVPGKPEWFDQLVNKVILEGDDVTKKLATVEREIVHTKKINNTDEVTVYQDLNTDSVRVEYKSPNNMFEDQVNLDYRKTPADEGSPKGSAEFEVTESGIVGRADGPADYSMDVEEVGGQSIKSLDSDVSALKEYATGEKQTLKEFVQSKKRKDKVKRLNEGDPDETSQYIVNRQGDYVPEPDDFASGGIARMLGE